MQNNSYTGARYTSTQYRVTDGTSVLGHFRTKKAALAYLAAATIQEGGSVRPLAEAGFRVERRTAEGWQAVQEAK